jgi:hypothetical protein
MSNHSLGEVEVEREFINPIPLDVMHINTSNVRRFTIMNPFTLDVLHIDGQYIPCGERLCLSFIKDDTTGQWKVQILSADTDDRMRTLLIGHRNARPASGVLVNGMDVS